MTTYEVLKILKDNEVAVSGSEIGDSLGVSRMAINKHIKKLQSLGYKIDCTPNSGYRLMDKDTLNSYELKYQLEKRGINIDNIIYKPTSSTNADANSVSLSCSETTLIAAPYQSQGKGRKNRTFISNEGGGYFSLIIKPKNFLISKAMFMTIIAALSVIKALNELNITAKIKWPNDIIFDNKKICGILCEAKSSGEDIDCFIIGIGININNELDNSIKDIATSIKNIKNNFINRASVIADIIYNIYDMLKIYERDCKELLEIYKSNSLTLGQNVTVFTNDNSYNAKAIGLTNDGFLIVERDGSNSTVLSGDVTIRN